MTRSIATACSLVAAVRWGALGPLVVASLALMGSPGPATISLTAVVSVHGVRRSLPYAGGIVVGTMIVLVAVATGLTAALLAVPALQVVTTALAAAYILWLACRIATAPTRPVHDGRAHAPSALAAFVLAVVNPKAWIAIAAVFAGTRVSGAATTDAAVKVAALTLMIVVIMTAWTVAGASLAPLLRDARRARIVNVSSAVALVAATALALLR